MKRLATLLLGAATVMGAAAAQPTQQQVDSVNAALATTFYYSVRPALNNMQAQGLPVDVAAFGRYLVEALHGGQPLGFDHETAGKYMEAYMQNLRKADTVSTASQTQWLAKAAKTKGVKRLPNGLLLEVVTEGTGPSPSGADTVVVNYEGQLSDGHVFDKTDGKPIEFALDHVIPGFSQGLRQMKTGGHYRLYIPNALAYGPEGIPGVIPGNSALLFDITLEAIKPSK